MKVLHISLKPVYPKVDGGCVAIDNFLKLLEIQFGAVDHICISTPKHPFQENNYAAELSKNVQLLRHFEINTAVNPFKLIQSLLTENNYQTDRFYSEEMNNYLLSVAKSYDYVFLESIYLLPYMEALSGAKKIIVRTHNAEHRIWESKSEVSNNPLKKIVFSRLSKKLRAYELENLNKVDGLIHISNDDHEIFRLLLPNIPQITIPLAIKKEELLTPGNFDLSAINIGFIGSANWQPNFDAIQNLNKVIFPAIFEKHENAQLFIGGYKTENIHPEHSAVINLGTLKNTRELFDRISLFLAPLTSGSGLKIKIVEAICNGKIVIGSEIAFEGLDFLPNNRIAKTTEDYLQHIDNILTNRQLKEEVSKQQDALLQYFGQETLTAKLNTFVNE